MLSLYRRSDQRKAHDDLKLNNCHESNSGKPIIDLPLFFLFCNPEEEVLNESIFMYSMYIIYGIILFNIEIIIGFQTLFKETAAT